VRGVDCVYGHGEFAMATRVVLNRAAIQALGHRPSLREKLIHVAQVIATRAQGLAPKRSGAGAASIHVVSVETAEGWTVRVSWDATHRYMLFQEVGTSTMQPRPFLRPALKRTG
jgi:HK97 gp10 family phage protein